MRPSCFQVRQKVVPSPTRVSLISGICVVASFRTTFKQSLTTNACTTETDLRSKSSPLNPIFMPSGAPPAHEVLLEMSPFVDVEQNVAVAHVLALHVPAELWSK